MKLVAGLLLLLAVLLIERGLYRSHTDDADWFAAHPNGGGV